MAESENTEEIECRTGGSDNGCANGGELEELKDITIRIIELNEKFIILHRQWFQLKNSQIRRGTDQSECGTNVSKLLKILHKIKNFIFGRPAAAEETTAESVRRFDELINDIKKVNDEIAALCRRREEIIKKLKI